MKFVNITGAAIVAGLLVSDVSSMQVENAQELLYKAMNMIDSESDAYMHLSNAHKALSNE